MQYIKVINMKIALTGFSFSGKTTAGKILADKLDIKFIDSDEMIESIYSDIGSIFSEHGEEYFRAIEEKIIKDIVRSNNDFVLSLGAGAVKSPDTVRLLKQNALTVWLTASVENIIARGRNISNRPLLNNKNKEQAVRCLYDQREGLYKFADIALSTDGKTPHQTVQEIINLIKCD